MSRIVDEIGLVTAAVFTAWPSAGMTVDTCTVL